MPHMKSEYGLHNCTIKAIFRLLLLVLALSDWREITFLLRKSHTHTNATDLLDLNKSSFNKIIF